MEAEHTTRVTLRRLAWYDVKNVTVETLAALEEWQRDKQIFPVRSTVAVEELPDGLRNYAAAYDASDSYRLVWWFKDRGISVEHESTPINDPR